jgi:hypothetical protein
MVVSVTPLIWMRAIYLVRAKLDGRLGHDLDNVQSVAFIGQSV